MRIVPLSISLTLSFHILEWNDVISSVRSRVNTTPERSTFRNGTIWNGTIAFPCERGLRALANICWKEEDNETGNQVAFDNLTSSNPTSATVALYGAAVALLKSRNFRSFKTEQLGSSLIAVLMPLANH